MRIVKRNYILPLVFVNGMTWWVLRAQNPTVQFEVASVRPSASLAAGAPQVRGHAKGGPGTNDPERISYEHALVRQLIMDAYNVQLDQITGPDWATTDPGPGALLFDVSAKVPPGSTKEQMRIMLQNLLAERFQLAVHHLNKQFSGYALVLAKSGSKLQPSAGTVTQAERATPAAGRGAELRTETDGFPELSPGRNMGGSFKDGVMRMRFRDYPLSDLVQQISVTLGAHMIDKTALEGRYDFKLEFPLPENGFPVAIRAMVPLNPGQQAPLDGAPPDSSQEEAVPLISSAMEKQLGLRLEPIKLAVDTLVIDRIEKKPIEN